MLNKYLLIEYNLNINFLYNIWSKYSSRSVILTLSFQVNDSLCLFPSPPIPAHPIIPSQFYLSLLIKDTHLGRRKKTMTKCNLSPFPRPTFSWYFIKCYSLSFSRRFSQQYSIYFLPGEPCPFLNLSVMLFLL